MPAPFQYNVAVLDRNGNLIMRIGQYGNVDDELGLFNACYAATHTDHRLFIADSGNARVFSVTLDYHASRRVALKDVPEGRAGGG